MPRGIPWDDLPNNNKTSDNKPNSESIQTAVLNNPPREIDFQKDLTDISRRIAFGVVVGLFLYLS
jgi:hypothetical protein